MKLKLVCVMLFISLVLMGCDNMENIDIPISDDEVDEIVVEVPEQIALGGQNAYAEDSSLDEEEMHESVEEETTQPMPETTPFWLDYIPDSYVSITPGQRIRALGSGLDLTIYAENSDYAVGILADSPHPLQLSPSEFDDATLRIYGAQSIMELEFTGDYTPYSLTVVRWNAKHLTGSQNISLALDETDSVAVTGNRIYAVNDGYDYIYSIEAVWTEGRAQGRAWFAFRTISGSLA